MAQSMEHIADIGIQVRGYTLQELFKNSLKEMAQILKEGCCDGVDHYDCSMRIVISSNDTTCLLIDFLSDVLALSYIQKTLFCHVYFSELSATKVDAQLYGIWFDHFDEEIKGVTYHEAAISRNAQGCLETSIIFDL